MTTTTAEKYEPGESEDIKSKLKRFALVCGAFLAWELLIMFTYAYSEDMVGLDPMLAWIPLGLFAIAGYFLFGFYSRTAWSIFFLAIPLLLAGIPETDITSGSFQSGEFTLNALTDIWLSATLVFVPAWFLGRLLGHFGRET